MVNMAFDCDKLLKELILTAKVPSLNKFEREVREPATLSLMGVPRVAFCTLHFERRKANNV